MTMKKGNEEELNFFLSQSCMIRIAKKKRLEGLKVFFKIVKFFW